MLIPPIPENEARRLEALYQLDILDTRHEEAYDRLVDWAARICDTPIALISLVDSKRQWFKAAKGIDACETQRDVSFCAHAILQGKVFIVPDALEDERFANNPLVTGEPKIRFYAGIPLQHPNGETVGTLCVIDQRPKQLSQRQIDDLSSLADHANMLLAMRVANKTLTKYQSMLEDERDLMAELMKQMMRPEELDSSAIEYWVQPTEMMGGDLVCASRSPHDKYYVLLADSTGHGLPAVINLLPINQIFHTMVSKSLPLALIIEEMNKTIKQQSPIDRFVAAVALCFDHYNSTVEVWNGGMPDALFISDDGKIQHRFKSTDMALGVNNVTYRPRTLIHQWDGTGQIFICSDGLFDACDGEANRMGMLAIETELVNSAKAERFTQVKQSVLKHLGGRSADDDISVVLIDLDRLGDPCRSKNRE